MLRLLLPMRKEVRAISRQSTRSLMKAVQIHEFGNPEVLQVNEIPEPVQGDNEVLVEVKAAGINPVDCYIRAGGFQVLPDLPAILGKEVAGIVTQTGRNVKKFKTGDRVFCCLPHDGGYAEVITCSEDLTFPLSKKLSFAQGACLFVAYFTAYRAVVSKCAVRKNEVVLVHGASGSVGTAATQFLKHIGAKVVATAGSEPGKEACHAAGADYIFNHNDHNYLMECLAVTQGQGYDSIIENAAHINLGYDLRMLASEGRVAIVGSRGDVTVTPRDLLYSEGSILGVQLAGHSLGEMNETAAKLFEGANEGWIYPIIEKEFKFDQAVEAHKTIVDRKASGNLVFTV